MKTLLFDTETTGFKNPHIIQLAYLLFEEDGAILEQKNYLFDIPDGIQIDKGASDAHGLYKEDLIGNPLFKTFIDEFLQKLTDCDKIVCHNTDFDIRMVKTEAYRNHRAINLHEINSKTICTMKVSTNLVKIPHARWVGKYKWPKLNELHQFLFNEDFENAHDALGDVLATYRCYNELKKQFIIK